jgi:hypothetical protein
LEEHQECCRVSRDATRWSFTKCGIASKSMAENIKEHGGALKPGGEGVWVGSWVFLRTDLGRSGAWGKKKKKK